MVRLLALLNKLDLDQVQRTGERARQGLRHWRPNTRNPKNVRGPGVMLAFDVQRADWREALRDRAFRRGLVLLPAGERVLRFYPRYDTEPSAIDEALAILRLALEDFVGGRVASEPTTAVEIRVGTLAIPLDTLEVVELTQVAFETHKLLVLAVEQERYGATVKYPPDVLRSGRRPLLQFPLETLETTASNVRCDWDRPARPCLITVRGLCPRQLARRPRRGGTSTPIPISARTIRSTCRRWPRRRLCKTTSSSRTSCWIHCERARSRPGSSFS